MSFFKKLPLPETSIGNEAQNFKLNSKFKSKLFCFSSKEEYESHFTYQSLILVTIRSFLSLSNIYNPSPSVHSSFTILYPYPRNGE